MQIADQSGDAIFDSDVIAEASIYSSQFPISNFNWGFPNAKGLAA